MTGDRADSRLSPQAPAKPTLTAEWRLAFELPVSGLVVHREVDTQVAAFVRGRRCWGSVWWVEKRLVGQWQSDTGDEHTSRSVVGSAVPRPRLTVERRHGQRRWVGEWTATTPQLRNAIIEVAKAKPRRAREFDPAPGARNGRGSHLNP